MTEVNDLGLGEAMNIPKRTDLEVTFAHIIVSSILAGGPNVVLTIMTDLSQQAAAGVTGALEALQLYVATVNELMGDDDLAILDYAILGEVLDGLGADAPTV
jgi:hypothetical protein